MRTRKTPSPVKKSRNFASIASIASVVLDRWRLALQNPGMKPSINGTNVSRCFFLAIGNLLSAIFPAREWVSASFLHHFCLTFRAIFTSAKSRTERHHPILKNTPASAFSLIEVMCAVLILGVALVGLSQGITTALSSSKESELQTIAAPIAAGQIETLRADKYLTDGETEGECGEELPLYRWKQTISRADVEGLHEVKVVVENSNTGKEIYELKTLLFDPESIAEDNAKTKKAKPDKSKKKGGLQ